MNHCSVISCLNKRKDKKYKFYPFPSDLDLCIQWVNFCHCPETSDRLVSGGPYGLRKFAICSEHFEQSAVQAAHRNGHLPDNAVPVRIGSTHMTQEMLLDKGFSIETQNENEADTIDHVLVEMLSAEEVETDCESESNFEIVAVKRIKIKEEPKLQDEIKQEIVSESIEGQTPSHPVAAEGGAKKEELDSVLDSTIQAPCKYCLNFKPRFEYEQRKNKRLEEVIAQNKRKISNATIEMQKLHDRITLRQMKLNELKNKFSELRKRCKKGIYFDEIPGPEAESDDEYDEAKAWW